MEWSEEDNKDDNNKFDINVVPTGPVKTHTMAQKLKFVACFEIMMEEIYTDTAGFEMEDDITCGQLCVWLENKFDALNKLFNFGGSTRMNEQGMRVLYAILFILVYDSRSLRGAPVIIGRDISIFPSMVRVPSVS